MVIRAIEQEKTILCKTCDSILTYHWNDTLTNKYNRFITCPTCEMTVIVSVLSSEKEKEPKKGWGMIPCPDGIEGCLVMHMGPREQPERGPRTRQEENNAKFFPGRNPNFKEGER